MAFSINKKISLIFLLVICTLGCNLACASDLETQKNITPAMIKEKLLITASCKGAVKANWPLTDIEMKTLLYVTLQKPG